MAYCDESKNYKYCGGAETAWGRITKSSDPEVEKKQEILYTNIQTTGLFGISFYAEKRRFA